MWASSWSSNICLRPGSCFSGTTVSRALANQSQARQTRTVVLKKQKSSKSLIQRFQAKTKRPLDRKDLAGCNPVRIILALVFSFIKAKIRTGLTVVNEVTALTGAHKRLVIDEGGLSSFNQLLQEQ